MILNLKEFIGSTDDRLRYCISSNLSFKKLIMHLWHREKWYEMLVKSIKKKYLGFSVFFVRYLKSLETCHSKSQEDHQNPSLIVNRVLTSRQLQCFFSKLEFSNNAKVAIQKIGKNHCIKYTRKLEFYNFTRWMGGAYFRLDKVNWHYAKWTKAMLCHYIVLWDREIIFFV